MQITETKAEGLAREYTVTVPAERLAAETEKKLLELREKVNIPGFRPGKIPMPLLKQRYGASVEGEVLEQTVNSTIQEVLAEKKLQAAMQPKVEVKSYDKEKGLEYTIALEIIPEMPEVNLQEINLEKLDVAVTEAEITEALQNVAESSKKYKEPAKNRAAKMEDRVTIDFLGKLNGVAFDGGKGDAFPLVLGSKRLIPGFEEAIVGFKLGESKPINVTFPADYSNADLAGKECTFDITVHKIEEPVERAIDEEFAKELGFENLEALKKEITERIKKEFSTTARSVLKRHLLDWLDEKYSFDLPQGLVSEEFKTISEQAEQEKLAHNHDHDHEHSHEEGAAEETTAEKPKAKGKKKAAAKTVKEEMPDLQPIAERRVKLGLLLADIGRRNNVQLSGEEIRQAILKTAYQYEPQMAKQILEYYRDNPQAIDAVRAPLYEDKVVDFILEKATLVEKQITKQEFEEAQKKLEELPTSAQKAA